ncbi:MAG: coat protein [Streptosporangiales bacterium]
MALENFVPELWAAEILTNINKNLVYAQSGVTNRNYEGEIRQAGDTVHINSVGRVTVRDYDPATGLSDPDTLDDYTRALLIDQQKEFNFMVDDINRVQDRPDVMSEATREAAYSLRDALDQFVAGLHTDAGRTIGSDASPQTVVAANPGTDETTAYDVLVDLSTLLSEKTTDSNSIEQGGVPEDGRFVVVDPAFHGLLRKDERFVHATAQGDDVIRNGVVGEAAGFRVLKSNNVPSVTGDGTSTFDNKKIIAGHPMAWSVAEQITKTEAYRPDKFFADALRGLHVYGGKVVRPYTLAVLSYTT